MKCNISLKNMIIIGQKYFAENIIIDYLNKKDREISPVNFNDFSKDILPVWILHLRFFRRCKRFTIFIICI
jgi:hypothetical protein